MVVKAGDVAAVGAATALAALVAVTVAVTVAAAGDADAVTSAGAMAAGVVVRAAAGAMTYALNAGTFGEGSSNADGCTRTTAMDDAVAVDAASIGAFVAANVAGAEFTAIMFVLPAAVVVATVVNCAEA